MPHAKKQKQKQKKPQNKTKTLGQYPQGEDSSDEDGTFNKDAGEMAGGFIFV